MSEYEKQRSQRIKENRAILEALGLPQITSSLRDLYRTSKNKKKDKEVGDDDDDEYIPENEGERELGSSSEQDDDFAIEDASRSRKRKMVKSLRLNSKRVSNDQPPPHSLQKQVIETQPNNAPNASEIINVEQAEANAGKHIIKKGRGHTINAKLKQERERLMAKGKKFDIQFPKPYKRICGKHAKSFKAEAQVCITQRAPLGVNNWREIPEADVDEMWKHMKDAFDLPDEVQVPAMKQVQSQFRTKQHNLYEAYLKKKGRPNEVTPEDWNWLINNKWSDPKFQERSLKNKANRNSENGEWPDVVEVWKATRMRSNGTWCIPNGEEIMAHY
ncbi:hypothetical protein SESBI_31285 [Sesbania bispinosa]|nr:hypothetical protein SESBI_31285 [Sesbania bispinosa]